MSYHISPNALPVGVSRLMPPKDGRLVLLEDNKKNQTILEYEQDRLTRVYKKTGEELRFSYGEKTVLHC